MSVQADGAKRGVDAGAADADGSVTGRVEHRDQLFEASLAYVKSNPLRLLQACWWAAQGSSHLRSRLAERHRLSPGSGGTGVTAPLDGIISQRLRPAPSLIRGGPRDLLESLRLHQWAKNLLVFVPIILAGQLTNTLALTDTAIAFFALSIVASSTYLINDMWDLSDD